MPSKPLPQRHLGKNGPLVPAMGFGLMGMSHTYGDVPSDESRFQLLDRAIELGETFWDSSDLYDDNEELIGKWFKRTSKRDQVFLATKFGYVGDGTGAGVLRIDSSAEYCKKACDKSLETLGVEYIDLYYAHNLNRETPVEETIRALAELKAAGKIKYIGLSSVSSNTLRRAYKVAPIDAVQVDYSVVTRDIEGPSGTDLLATCRELGVAVVCAMPLGRGLLTSTFSSGQALAEGKDVRTAAMPRFQAANIEHNRTFVAKFGALAEKKGCTIPQLALAWLLKQGDDVIPIPGTKQIKYLEQNVAALDVLLSDEDEAGIREFLAADDVAGGVVPDAYKSFLFADTKEEGA